MQLHLRHRGPHLLFQAGHALAQALHSPQAFEKAGTVIVAVTGLFVVTQVLDEIRMERLLAQAEDEGAEKEADLPAVARLAFRIRRNLDHTQASEVRQARLTLVVLIALWLSFGEVVSGFGDLAFEALWRARAPSPAAATPTLTR